MSLFGTMQDIFEIVEWDPDGIVWDKVQDYLDSL